jgi:hypothetical protein
VKVITQSPLTVVADTPVALPTEDVQLPEPTVAPGSAPQTAYKVVFDAIDHVEVDPAANEVPDPFATVFHPENE